ncbi:uncharacterized protein LOC122075948 [Macadamia integrifolia]|uniref:uncharacterized protein LOC122075948 n=1 Tax=Macadamia integrifolia TaxID=60698 RepID=UPI001C4E803C|nr:uncharacterized protein LOC122075948 [Macadamia integrifolia]
MHTDMKLKLLSWFLFLLLFSQTVSRSASDTTFSRTYAASELSENIRGKQPVGSNGTIGMDMERRGRGSEIVKNVQRKGQKGSGGGSDLNRRPPRTSHGGASTFPASPSLVIDVVLQVSIGLLIVFHFFF